MTEVGLWIDCPPRRVVERDYWGRLRDLGIRVAAIMLDSPRPQWDPTWAPDQVGRACELARERDIAVVLTTWPLPDAQQIDAMAEDLDDWLRWGAVAWEVDLEALWRRGHLTMESMAVAADYLVATMRRVCEPLDVRVEVTSHPGHRETGPTALVSPRADRLVVQAYSTRHDWRDQLVGWSSRGGPGRCQHLAVARAQSVPGALDGRPRISLGLAAWDQQWPDHAVSEALDRAWGAAVEGGPAEIRLWSSKWLVGSQSRRPGQAEVIAWLEQRAGR
jgi:hypothetical protein